MAEPSGRESPDVTPDSRSEMEAVAPQPNPAVNMGGSWSAPAPSNWQSFLDWVAPYIGPAVRTAGAFAPSLGPIPGAIASALNIANTVRRGADPGWDILNTTLGGIPGMARRGGEWLGNTVAELRGMTPADRLAEGRVNRARDAAMETAATTRGGGPSAEPAGATGTALTPQAPLVPPAMAPMTQTAMLMPRLPGEWLTLAKPLVQSKVLPMATDLPGEQSLDLHGADPRFDPRARQALPPEALAYLKALSRVIR